MRRRAASLLAVVAALLTGGSAAAQDAVRWLTEEPAGILPLEDESRAVVRLARGSLELRSGEAREVRWVSVSAEGARPLPLSVGLADGEVVLAAPEGDAVPRRLIVTLPEAVKVRVEAQGTKVEGSGLGFPLAVEGSDLDVRLNVIEGPLELTLADGAAVLATLHGSLTVRGRPKSVVAEAIDGPVLVSVQSGQIGLSAARGGLDLDVQNGSVALEDVSAPVVVRARGGGVHVKTLRGGGDFDLAGASLVLEKVSGDVTIRSDASVQLLESEADLHLHGIGASLRASRNRGLIEVVTDSAEVHLAHLEGPLRVQGNSLRVRLEDVTGDTALYTSGSTIDIQGLGGSLTVENEFGDVSVVGASDRVQIKNRDGDVRLGGLSGAVIVEADSEVVSASWASLNGQDESYLSNDGGEIRVELPSRGSYSVEAEARYGRVQSGLDWVRVADDGRTAEGTYGRVRVPRIRIVASGDVVLSPTGGEAAEGARGGRP